MSGAKAPAAGFAYGFSAGFGYQRPKTSAEVCKLLASEPEAKLLAGGTDLLVEMRNREIRAGLLVDLKGLRELRRIERTGDVLQIGALATVSDLLADAEVHQHLPVLVDASRVFACQEIRHRATVGGNIAHASPGAEFGTPLVVLDASAVIEGVSGQRVVPIEQFFVGPGKSCLDRAKGEFLSALRIPIPKVPTAMQYRRYSRVKGMDLACAALSVLVKEPGSVAKREVRLALGAVAPVPALRKEAGALLSGKAWIPELVQQAKEAMLQGIEPRRSSIRSTPEYKKHILGVYLEDALRAFDRATEARS
ncbi:MAG TPA: xanthine dehydrogenase family protein subunit M [Myxococcales bacterium]|jgi:CO/xanthine dehydrogenase FAD-binding subunit